jgi:hypothetical protein
MKAAAAERAAPPWPWSLVRYCLDLATGDVRHFPAGTYHAQTETAAGRLELEMMSLTHQAWLMFKGKKSLQDWSAEDLRFARWMSEDEQPEPPTLTIDGLLRWLWATSGMGATWQTR